MFPSPRNAICGPMVKADLCTIRTVDFESYIKVDFTVGEALVPKRKSRRGYKINRRCGASLVADDTKVASYKYLNRATMVATLLFLSVFVQGYHKAGPRRAVNHRLGAEALPVLLYPTA